MIHYSIELKKLTKVFIWSRIRLNILYFKHGGILKNNEKNPICSKSRCGCEMSPFATKVQQFFCRLHPLCSRKCQGKSSGNHAFALLKSKLKL